MKIVDEYTLEIIEVPDEDVGKDGFDEAIQIRQKIRAAANCEPEEISEKYTEYKRAEEEFKKVYEPFKTELIKLYKEDSNFPKGIIIGNTKLTYVSPSTRSTVDTKKLKEEHPEIVKEFTKTTNVAATMRIEEVISHDVKV